MKAVSGCFCLCGGTFAGTNSTCRREYRLEAARASVRCPRWIGSKLPPKRPIFIPIFPAMFLRCPASFIVAGHCGKSCSQTCSQTDYELCSLIADLYQRVLRKASYEIRL